MTDLTDRIQALDADMAERLLKFIAADRLARGQAAALTPDPELAAALAAEAGTAPDASADPGELAKSALLLLADDPAMNPTLEQMLDHPPPESYGAATIAVVVAALVVLQSHIKIERDKAGKWVFKFEKKPTSNSLLTHVIAKIGGWLRLGG